MATLPFRHSGRVLTYSRRFCATTAALPAFPARHVGDNFANHCQPRRHRKDRQIIIESKFSVFSLLTFNS
jgi:hypothetical protein